MKTEEELCNFLAEDLNKIERLCRICLSDDLLNAVLLCTDLQKDVEDVESLEAKLTLGEKLSLWEKIILFGRVNVSHEDELLKYICKQCYYNIDVAYTFRIKCQKAEKLLIRVLQTLSGEQNDASFIDVPIVDEKDHLDIQFNIKEEYSHHNVVEEDCVIVDDSENEEENKMKVQRDIFDGKEFSVTNDEDDKEMRTSEECKDTVEYHSCNICHIAWTNKASLINHMNCVHGKEKKEQPAIVTGQGYERRINCPECDFKCKTWKDLNCHMATHTELDKKRTLNINRRVWTKKLTHTNNSHRKKRKNNLQTDKQVESTKDSSSNQSSQAVDKNKKVSKIVNDEKKKFTCVMCHEAWTSRTLLSNHVNNMHGVGHGAERLIRCPECGHKTKRYYVMKIHMVTHTGLKAYKCDRCDKAFTQSSNLNSHKKKHCNNTQST